MLSMMTFELVLLFLIFQEVVKGQDCSQPRLEPPLRIGVLGLKYHFTCQNFPKNSNIVWYINDTLYENGSISNVTYDFTFSGSNKLTFDSASEDSNNSMIICSVRYSEDCECNSTTSKFQVQGLLMKVSDLRIQLKYNCSFNNLILIQWIAPFSLNLTSIINDIHYNIIVIYESKIILMEEDITMTEITSLLNDTNPSNITCGLFEATVTPYNAVGLGPSSTVFKIPLSEVNTVIDVIEGQYFERNAITYSLSTYPAICEVEVKLVDIYNYNKTITLSEDNVQVITNCSENSIIIISTSNSGVQENHKYMAYFNLSNSDGSVVSTNISTHSVQDYDFHISHINEVTLSIIYLHNTNAKGAVLLFMSEMSQPVLLALNLQKSMEYTIPSYFASNKILIYDIRDDGLLPSNVAYSATDLLTIPNIDNDKGYTSKTNNKCHTKVSEEHTLNITCECDQMPNIIGYQAVLFNDSDKSGLLYTSTSNCSENVTIGINTNFTHYLTVFGIERDKGITESIILYEGNITNNGNIKDNGHTNYGLIIGIAVGSCGFLLVVSTACVLLCILLKRCISFEVIFNT